MARAQATRARPTKQPHPIAIVIGFADLPCAGEVLAAFGVPRSLSSLGFFIYLREHQTTLFERHPERAKLAAKASDAALALVDAIATSCRFDVFSALGHHDLGATTFVGGFHTDLEARALAKAFAADRFEVVGVEALGDHVLSKLAGKLEPARVPAFARAVLDAGAPIDTVLAVLHRERLPPLPAKLHTDLVARLAPQDVAAYRHVVEATGMDLVAAALPVVERLCGTKRAKPSPRAGSKGLPAELAKLLASFDGILELGVLSAATVATETAAQADRLAKAKPQWRVCDGRVRRNPRWQPGWTAFARDKHQIVCVDETPTKSGTKGQVIAIDLDASTLSCEARSIGDWLWTQLARL